MATKRFTDSEKWKDPFFENLSNDFKLIWLYLLDDVDNAGVWNKSINRLNFYCNTNITEEKLLEVFKKRLQPLTEDKWFIKKFMEFQYGLDWMNSGSKAVVSARKKLEEIGILKDNTLSILYQKPINTLSEENVKGIDTVKDKDKDKVKEKEEDKSMDKSKEQDKVKDKELEPIIPLNVPISEDVAKAFDELFKDV